MAALYVIRGKDFGRHYFIQKDCTGIGRDEANELQLQDTEVSRHHVAILRNQDRYQIKDLGSSNGTYLNSSKVLLQELKSGDRLQIGRTLMIFTGGSETEEKDHPGLSSSPDPTPFHDVEIVRSDKEPAASRIVRAFPSDHASLSASWPLHASPSSIASVQQRSSVHKGSSSKPIAGDSLSEPNRTPGESSQEQPLSYWEVVYRTSLAVSRTLDIDQLVAQILDLIFQTIDCDRGCILLMDEETRSLQPACRRNRSLSERSDRMQISKTILDYVIDHVEGVYTSNAQEDQRWDSAASIVQMGIREAICVPMQGRYGVVGAIYIDTSTSIGKVLDSERTTSQSGVSKILGRFNEEHLKLMVAIGNQAALAVEDTTYYRGMVQSERLAVMGQTIATLSHHIKNILQGIRGGSYLVSNGLEKRDLDVIARGWKIVDRNQDRIGALVMDMLTFSKDRVLALSPADPRTWIDDVFELMLSRAAEAKVALDWTRPERFPQVDCDAESMHRALLNIVTNAIDAAQTVESGKVTISLRIEPEKQLVILEVQDNGPGIPEDQQSRIFSVFESSKGSRGTGLGLPVSRKILREHAGDIEIISPPGKGTRFLLIWPIHSNKPQAEVQGILERPTTF